MTETELYRRLGRAVAARRVELKLTQENVAQQLGLSRASLANLESGRQRIMIHQLFRLVNALKLKTILDLVPPRWEFETDLPDIKVVGEQLTPKEEATIKSALAGAFADSRTRRSP